MSLQLEWISISADDYLETKLNLTEYLVKHPSSTYYIKVVDDSIIGYGIFRGDLLIVNRTLHSLRKRVRV